MSAISGYTLRRLAIFTLGIALAACQNKDTSPSPTPDPAPITYSVSATVTGLDGTGLVLQNNGGGDITVTANGSVTFASNQASGTAYAVTVLTQPSGTTQTCTVAGGAGTIAQANVTNVTVTCTDNFVPTYAPAPKGDPQGTRHDPDDRCHGRQRDLGRRPHHPQHSRGCAQHGDQRQHPAHHQHHPEWNRPGIPLGAGRDDLCRAGDPDVPSVEPPRRWRSTQRLLPPSMRTGCGTRSPTNSVTAAHRRWA